MQIGIIGLGRMGGNIARRLMKAGHTCVVYETNAARPSGTEDIYKIYAESFRSADHLKQIQTEEQTAIGLLLGKS